MSKYQLIPFTNETLEQARGEWEAIAGNDAFDVELSPVFVWVESHMVATPNDSVALCLWNKDIDRIDAIVEVVDSRKGQLSKLLKVIPSPKFWDTNSSRADIIQLYFEVFFNVITGGGFTASRKVKLYGRDDEMMSLLRSIHAHWAIQNSTAEFEGRFLAISIN
jgi:hypothetical protein